MRCCEFTTATHILFYFLRSLSRYRAHGKLWKLPRSLRFAFRVALGQSIEVLWRRANAYCDVILTDCSRIVMSFREYISQVILEISQNLCHRKDIFKDQSFRSVRSIDFILTNSLYQIYVSPISLFYVIVLEYIQWPWDWIVVARGSELAGSNATLCVLVTMSFEKLTDIFQMISSNKFVYHIKRDKWDSLMIYSPGTSV